MGTEFKDIDMNMEDSGNSCGSSVVSDFSGPSDHTDFFDGDGDDVQVSDLEGENDKQDNSGNHGQQIKAYIPSLQLPCQCANF